MKRHSALAELPVFEGEDFGYGEHSPIEVIRIVPNIGKTALDPYDSLDHEYQDPLPFTESDLEDKVVELARNYRIIGDPKSSEASPKQFGITILNEHLLAEGVEAIVVHGTNGSHLYDEEGNPNNAGNAVELAYLALKYDDRAVVFIESPGNGNSSDLSKDEYKAAAKDGKLVEETRNDKGVIVAYEAFETMQAMARALEAAGIKVSHITANASGAHFSTALMAALPKNTMQRAFLYNATNISDRNSFVLGGLTLNEIRRQGRYEKLSNDPLKLTDERIAMAKRVMSDRPKRKIDLARGRTHNPRKMLQQNKIFSRGNEKGQAAAVQAAIAELRHKDLKQTFIFPEFAAHYKRPEDFYNFMLLIRRLGGNVCELQDLESLKIPLGQYGHTHYPSVRQNLEEYGFNR